MAGEWLGGYEPSIDLVRRLVMVPGPSGYEEPVRRAIEEQVRGLGRLWSDRLGNLVLELGGSGPRVVMAAHMDELGLVVTDILESGRLAFRKLGGIWDGLLPGSHVVVHTSRGPVPGVIGATPPHIRRILGEDQGRAPRWSELEIDIGAETREEALELGVRPLDPVTPVKHFALLAGGRYMASRAIDDRSGCAALVELARLVAEGLVRPRVELALAWTVQEEVGLRGASALAHRLEPDVFVAVDTVTCCHPRVSGPLRLGRGPALRLLDNTMISPRWAAEWVRRAAGARGIPLQVAPAGGGTDAGAFQQAGVASTAVTLPTMYTHSLVEKASTSDYRELVRLLAALAEHGPEPP